MNSTLRLLIGLFVAAVLGLAINLRAETLDLDDTNLVIEKLTRLLDTLDTDSTSKIPMTLRLADLYSDRARLMEMQEKEKEAKNDRLQAIKYFNSVFKNLDKQQKSKTLSQLAHLYLLTGQSKQAKKLFVQIVSHPKNHDSTILALAHAGLADIQFADAEYRPAEKHFQSALKLSDLHKNYLTTRLAWCYYHEGKAEKAKQTIYSVLSNHSLDNDSALKEDAARDYATFLALGHVDEGDVQSLEAVSPEGARQNILSYFATELDRLGKKKAALMVWKHIGSENPNKGDLFESFKLVQAQYDLGHKEGAVEELGKMMAQWKSKGCDNKSDNCDLLKAKVRKLITDWGASEQRDPSKSLVQAYVFYTDQFPDKDLYYWGAQAAQKIKMYNESISLYRKASDLAVKENAPKIAEGACLGEIEMAEASQNPVQRNSAYDHYLALLPNGEKALEVKYQKAHILYEQKAFAQAAPAFHEIAVAKDAHDMTVREKAADISLESLIAAHDENNIETWSKEYAVIFPKRNAEFQKTARDAVLNRESKIINDKEASHNELVESLKNLKAVNMEKATPKERLTTYKNRLLVAEKLLDYSEVTSAADGMLTIKPLSGEDRELALSRKEWAAEMTGQFSVALSTAKTLKMKGLHEDEKLIKLADLSDKAKQDSTGYYEKYLRVTRNQAGAEGVLAKLIRHASSGAKAHQFFNKYVRILNRNIELKSVLALEIFARTNDETFARHLLQSKQLRRTSAGVVLARFIFLSDFQYFAAKHKPARLNTRNALILKRSLNDRIYLIRLTERFAQRAVKSQDWISQLVSLDLVRRHYASLAAEINSLPVPRGLNRKQKENYRKLLAAQAQPYAAKADSIFRKIYEIADSENTDKLIQDLKETKEPLRQLVIKQARIVMNVLPTGKGLYLKRELGQLLAVAK